MNMVVYISNLWCISKIPLSLSSLSGYIPKQEARDYSLEPQVEIHKEFGFDYWKISAVCIREGSGDEFWLISSPTYSQAMKYISVDFKSGKPAFH